MRSQVSDRDLDKIISKVQRGNEEAFAELFQAFEMEVRNLAFRLGVTAVDIDDVAQEVWLKVWRFIPGFRKTARFETWFYRVVFNTVIDLTRKRPPEALMVDFEDLDVPDGDAGVDPEALAVMWADVRPLLDALSWEYRAAVVLVDGHGLSHEQAADVLGEGLPGFRSRLRRARAVVKRLYEEGLDE